jgi:hypothetical protein
MDLNPKQAVAEKLRSSSSVLVTVSNNPSVDQLASALGLSLMLNKLGKHTTTVFSGKIPNTMEFLDPEKTFDTTVDGLRDFIISLDKEKADKLRYKVEDDVVKIFITPYKQKISENDLNFSQGDFNVDLVVALGVRKRDELDNAITSHGRILHDATIVTINAGRDGEGNLGAVDWSEPNASCLAEMLVSISEALEGGILDKQMSTAFLTGIVAATDRFKNEATTPKIMTMAAQLMAAGANQQLIAEELQITQDIPLEEDKPEKQPAEKPADSFAEEDQTMAIDREQEDKPKNETEKAEEGNESESDSKQEDSSEDEVEEEKPKPEEMRKPHLVPAPSLDDDDILTDIESAVHAKHNELDDTGRTKKIDDEDPAIKELEDELSHDSSSSLLDIEDKMKGYSPDRPQFEDDKIGEVKSVDAPGDMPERPAMGGTFNATAEEAHDQREEDRANSLNHEILSHKSIEPSAPVANANDIPSSADLMKDLEEARRAVEDAMNETDFDPAFQPSQALNAAPLPLDEQGMTDFNVPSPPPMQPNNFQPPSPMSPPPMQPPQMPQQQPMSNGNPMFNQPMQQTYPSGNAQNVYNSPSPMSPPPMQPPQMPQQQPMSNGNPMFNQQPQQGQYGSPPPMAPPQMPPSAPPPMPPFN